MEEPEKKFPKPNKIRVSLIAYQNLEEITSYIGISNNQPVNAVKVGNAIFKVIDRIALNPFAFKECEQLKSKTKIGRQVVYRGWLFIRLLFLKF